MKNRKGKSDQKILLINYWKDFNNQICIKEHFFQYEERKM